MTKKRVRTYESQKNSREAHRGRNETPLNIWLDSEVQAALVAVATLMKWSKRETVQKAILRMYQSERQATVTLPDETTLIDDNIPSSTPD